MKRASTLLVFFLIPGVGRADLVTYFISGKVGVITDTSPNHYVPTSITPNVSDFIGSFTFDNSAPGTGGAYRGTALQLSAHITIDGKYDYIINSPTANDEIDIFGTSFGLYLRGPTVALNFAPNPPFSHFEFQGTTQTTILSQVVLGPTGTAGVSDQQTPDDFYYFIGTNTSTVVATPEPTSLALVGVFAGGLLFKRWRKTQGEFPSDPKSVPWRFRNLSRFLLNAAPASINLKPHDNRNPASPHFAKENR